MPPLCLTLPCYLSQFHVDINDSPTLAFKYGIDSPPTVIVSLC